LTNADNLKDVVFYTENDGIIVGDNYTIMKTVDGGESWFMVTPTIFNQVMGLKAVAFSSTSDGMIVGENGIEMYTTDGGATWTFAREETMAKSHNNGIKKISNYPNPFNPSTKISFELPLSASVSVQVFDITGREVANLFNGSVKSGLHEFVFDASSLSSGAYFYRIAANMNGSTEVHTGRMLLVK
jgi:hypothetical protein